MYQGERPENLGPSPLLMSSRRALTARGLGIAL